MAKLETRIGKYLCYILRHDEDFVLDSEGWVNIERLIGKLKRRFNELKNKDDKEVIDFILDIVKNDNKQRYSINESSGITWIRCDYGHTNTNINIIYNNDIPPIFLYHGTSKENYEKIVETGKINIMDRHHVHLSENIETAINTGKRHGDPVVIVINAYDMYKNGSKFHKIGNNTWLSDDPIDICYENRLIDTDICNEISKNRKNKDISKNSTITDMSNCNSAAVVRISDDKSNLTAERINSIFNELIEHNKGDFPVFICGSNEYYMYVINTDDKKMISIDTSPDEFEDYFFDE